MCIHTAVGEGITSLCACTLSNRGQYYFVCIHTTVVEGNIILCVCVHTSLVEGSIILRAFTLSRRGQGFTCMCILISVTECSVSNIFNVHTFFIAILIFK